MTNISDGIVTNIDPDGTVTIKAKLDIDQFIKQRIKRCEVFFIDERKLSDKQRKSCYAMINEISEYTGQDRESTKQFMKLRFMSEQFPQMANMIFSLSDAPKSLVAEFQKFLVEFILQWDIPTKKSLLDFVDDIGSYVYSCLSHRKCCICGRHADLHHWDRVGMGGDRTKIRHIGLLAEPLCREHHQEAHGMPRNEFDSKYHIAPVKIDEFLVQKLGLNKLSAREKRFGWETDGDVMEVGE